MLVAQVDPVQVWNFMGDFSNYKYLNPHLTEWELLQSDKEENGHVVIKENKVVTKGEVHIQPTVPLKV